MTILRALHVLETQTESKLLARRRSPRCARTSRPGCCCPTRSSAIRRCSARCTWRWSARARRAACSRSACCARPISSRRTPRCRRQIRAAMIYPTLVISFALIVLLALVAFLIPVFEGVFKEFHGNLPALTQFMVDFSHLLTTAVVHPVHRGRGARQRIPVLQALEVGTTALGRVQAPDPDEDRRRRAEGGDRTLVAHVLVADDGRRPDPPGDRDHREDRRQRRGRAGDGRRDRVGQVRRHDLRAAEQVQGRSRRWSRT